MTLLYSISVLTKLGQPHSNIAKFIFENALNAIAKSSAQTILYAIAQFRSGASREALGYLAELPELDLDDGLVQLQKLSLVNQLNGRFDILPSPATFSPIRRLSPMKPDSWFRSVGSTTC